MSIAGGFYKAVEAAATYGMETVQIFTHSPSQWAVKPAATSSTARKSEKRSDKNDPLNHWQATPLASEATEQFQAALRATGIRHPVAHASYLINLAATDQPLWERSRAALVVELQRAAALGLAAVIVHPGALTGGDWETGSQRIATAAQQAIDHVPGSQTKLLLENTAGQGTTVGHRLEELAELLAMIDRPDRCGLCIDTCHAHAAGYPLDSEKHFEEFRTALDAALPKHCVQALHLNDSQRPAGSRVDRHAHIGHGTIGRSGFRRILEDSYLGGLPMYLETPKGIDPDTQQEWDAINLATLRDLCPGTPRRRPSAAKKKRPRDT
jgi:deoxyribonuclease-4